MLHLLVTFWAVLHFLDTFQTLVYIVAALFADKSDFYRSPARKVCEIWARVFAGAKV